MVFHWSLNDSKSPQVSRTLLSILAVLNNAVVWMVSILSPTSKSSNPFNNPLVTVPKAPIIIGKNVTFLFHSFFSISLRGRGTYLSFSFFQFYSVVSRNSKVHSLVNSLFFFCWSLFVLVFWLRFIIIIIIINIFIIIHSSFSHYYSLEF